MRAKGQLRREPRAAAGRSSKPEVAEAGGAAASRPSKPHFLLTIGHSNRSLQEFQELLKAHGVEQLADVRRMPQSRHNPQFNRDSLPGSLAEQGIEYVHMPGLGGLRKPRKDSRNTGWRNDSFRGYADYMETQDFEENLAELIQLGEKHATVIMCAESVPWRCHRSLIADALTARGIEVRHIINFGKPKPHEITSFAVVEGRRVHYPPETLELF